MFIFFAEVALTEIKLGIQIYHKDSQVKFEFGYDRAIYGRVMHLGLIKIRMICSFCSFPLHIFAGGGGVNDS